MSKNSSIPEEEAAGAIRQNENCYFDGVTGQDVQEYNYEDVPTDDELTIRQGNEEFFQPLQNSEMDGSNLHKNERIW